MTFTVDAYEYPFTGLVTQVRRNPTTVQNVVTYDVVVAASNPQLLLAPGMTANVKIVTEERENMLRVPLQAVRYESGADPQNRSPLHGETPGAFLWVLDRGRRERLPVRTGIYDTHYVQIVSDRVHSGDLALVQPMASTESSDAEGMPPPPVIP